AEGKIRIFDVHTGLHLLEFVVEKNRRWADLSALALDSHGKRLVYATEKGGLTVLETLPTDSPPCRAPQAIVDGLFRRPVLKDDVIAHIQNDRNLDETRRRECLRLAENRHENLDELKRFAVKNLLSFDDVPTESYDRAKHISQVLFNRNPSDR